ncbi:MAG: ankyrin repeat domain-containing protein, partial [Treponemataceae bacterium]|nr:ankyrin repeat domain-containing protein [Treponemataceae bacterium]
MSAIKKTRAKLILFLLLLAVPASVLPAADYDELMRDGTLEEITAAFKKDGEMHRAKIGDEKDSLLMRAVKYGRTESVVALLLKAGVSVSAKNKDGRTALMYACLHSHDAAVIRLLLEKSGSRRSVRKKLLQADSFGKSALDYARLNPSPAALSLIEPYLTEGDLKASSPDSEYGADAQPFLEQTARTVFSPYSSGDGASALEAEEDEIPPPAEEPAGAGEPQEEDGASPDAAAAAADTSVPAAVLPPAAAGQLLADAAPGGRLDKDTEAVLEPSGADVGGYQKMYLYD